MTKSTPRYLRLHPDSTRDTAHGHVQTRPRRKPRPKNDPSSASISDSSQDIASDANDDEDWIERLLSGTDAAMDLRIDKVDSHQGGDAGESDSGEMLDMLRSGQTPAVADRLPFGLPERLDRIVGDAAAAANFDAGAIYLLNETTTGLKTVSLYGLNPSRLMDPMRDLANARGDLEALVSGIFTMDHIQDGPMDHWNIPEKEFGAAICSAILDADYPLGTLWLFAHQTLAITPAESAVARLASDSIAQLLREEIRRGSRRDTKDDKSSVFIPSDFSADLLATDRTDAVKVFPGGDVDEMPQSVQEAEARMPATDSKSALQSLAAWQYCSLPPGTRLAEDWFVDGMIESGQDWAIGWHHWDILPDGTLAMLMAEASDPSVAGAMTATFARSAAISHLNYRHTAEELLSRVSDTLWQMNVDQQTCSLMYAKLDMETGNGELCYSGQLNAMIVSRHGHRPLALANSRPLASDFDPSYQAMEFHLQRGEVMIGINQEVAELVGLDAVGRVIRDGYQESMASPLALLRQMLADKHLASERGAMALLRR